MTDRLDRIEAILGNVAERQERTDQQHDRMQQNLDRMQQNLDRTQMVVDSNARAIEANQERADQQFDRMQQNLDRTQMVVDSNARAIEANSAAMAQGRQETIELKAYLREEVGNLVMMMVDLGNNLQEQIEQDRAERLTLSAEVRSLVEALRERFRSNGHG
jgi:DNA repair exonuclease SbcCD ATPase subunit